MNNIDINSPEFDIYLDTLNHETVDALDGTILSPGQAIIRSPLNTVLVALDTPDRRRQFAEMGFAWDEPTRIRIVQTEVDKRVRVKHYSSICSIDVAYELKLSVELVESAFKRLAEQSSDYYLDDTVTDSAGKPCLAIDKRK